MSSHPPPSPSSLQHQEITPGSNPLTYGNTQFGDTTLTKVFVGGLAWETTREGLRLYFEQFGEILEAVVITDKVTGRSKGYGFVTFRDPEGARRACADPTPAIDGRRANCNLASLGVRSRPGTPQGGKYRGGSPTLGRSPSRAQPFSATSSPQHLPFPHQQGYAYPSYGYPPYQQEYLYTPNMVYNGPYMMTPQYLPPFFGSGGGGPPPPSLGGPAGGGMYPGYRPYAPHQTLQQVPFPYSPSPFGAGHMLPQNQPLPSGLTPDQSPPPAAAPGGVGVPAAAVLQQGAHSHQASQSSSSSS